MVFTTSVAKIAAGVDSKLFADNIVRRNVVFVVSLAKVGSPGKALMLWIPPISNNILLIVK